MLKEHEKEEKEKTPQIKIVLSIKVVEDKTCVVCQLKVLIVHVIYCLGKFTVS